MLLANGIPLLLEAAPELPVISLGFSLRTGTLHDPRGREGLTRLMAASLRMGIRGLSARSVAEALDRLGGRLSISAAPHYVHLGGVVLARNLESYLELVGALLTRPAFRATDLRQLKRETLDDLRTALDDDRGLAVRHLRRFALTGHSQSRSSVGTPRSLRAIDRARVVDHHRRHVTTDNLVVSAAGPVQPDTLRELLERHLGGVRRAVRPRKVLTRPKLRRGRRLLIVDKPDRVQAQVLIGSLAPGLVHPDRAALTAANTAFGGLFTSRLMNEVRSKRGWSYGASSALPHGPGWDLWSMGTAPSLPDVRGCIALQLELYDNWLRDGITARELTSSRSYLIKSRAFETDTAAKRIDLALERCLFGLPRDYHDSLPRRLRALSRHDVNGALSRCLSNRDVAVVVLATAGDVKPELAELPGIDSVEEVPYDRI